jgi:hypothetical protein
VKGLRRAPSRDVVAGIAALVASQPEVAIESLLVPLCTTDGGAADVTAVQAQVRRGWHVPSCLLHKGRC